MDKTSNSTSVPTVSIGGVEIQKIEYRGQQVVTFAMIDKVHKRPDGTAKRNFDENRIRFESGTDFVLVSLVEMRQAFPGAFPARGGGDVTLMTQRGYLKLTKPMNDDRAWEVQDEMIDVYFAAMDGKINVTALPLPKKLKAVGDVMQGFSRLAGLLGLKGSQRALSAAMATQRETGVNVLQLTGITHLDADIQEQEVTPTLIGERLTPKETAARVNEILARIGLQVKHPYTSKGKAKHYWELTPKGEAAGAIYKDTTKKHDNGTPVKQIKWPVSVIALLQAELNK